MKYFQGVRVFCPAFPPFSTRRCAVTLPGLGIVCSKALAGDVQLLRHEFGHILQRRYFGWWFYWFCIAPVSLWSAVRASFSRRDENGRWTFLHADTWTEWSANRLSYAYFRRPSGWPLWLYPLRPRMRRAGSRFPGSHGV